MEKQFYTQNEESEELILFQSFPEFRAGFCHIFRV